MAFCGNCGTQLDDGVQFCPNCGAPIGANNADAGANPEQQTQPIQPPIQQQTYDNNQYNNVNAGEEQGKKQAIVSFVLGIVGVVLLFFGVSSIVSFILGIIGLVFANKSKALGHSSGFRTAGFVLSLISIIIGIIVFIVAIVAIVIVGAGFGFLAAMGGM